MVDLLDPYNMIVFLFNFQVSDNHKADTACVKVMDFGPQRVRISFHLNISEEMTDLICQKIQYIFEEIRGNP